MEEQFSPALSNHISKTQNINVQPQVNSNQSYQQKVNLEQKPDTFEKSGEVKKKKANKKKIAIITGAVIAAAATASGIIYGIKKGKIGKSKDVTEKAAKEIATELRDIKFDKGIASLKENGEKFTGTLNHTLKSGDKVALEYADGVIQKSTRSGVQNFEKVYETLNGEKLIHKTQNGVTETINVTKIQNEAKSAQDKLKKLLADKDISSEDFQKQAADIKYKSKAQVEEITKTTQAKQKAEAELKAKLEAEAKAKAAAEEEARIAAEKAQAEAAEQAKAEAAKKAMMENKHELETSLRNLYSESNLSEKEIEERINSIFNAGRSGGSVADDIRYGFVTDGQIHSHGDAYAINRYIRENPNLSSKSKDILDIEFQHLNPTAENLKVYRGVNVGGNSTYRNVLDDMWSKKIGESVHDSAYAYASFQTDIAEYWAGDNGILFEINIPKGAKVSCSRKKKFGECLFPRNAEFKILDKTIDATGKKKMILEYILPNL